MCAAEIHISGPDFLTEAIQEGSLGAALNDIARLAGVGLHVARFSSGDNERTSAPDAGYPLEYHGRRVGFVECKGATDNPSLKGAVRAVTSLLEHVIDREMAIGDLAEEMIASYEELNMLYSLLPSIATSVHPAAIGEALVDETVRTVHCKRVSLLVLDESGKNFVVLASRGLPSDLRHMRIPIADSISERAMASKDPLIINRIGDHPELAELSRGQYGSDAFAVVRVTLRARGEVLGVLTATDRHDSPEFTARDQKLLEGLAAMGATALLNCRLHHAINRQMITTIRALASAIDAKDQYTHAHSARVAQLAVATARELGIADTETLREVELAGLLHDIGKIGISDAILSKEGRLTPEEFAVVRTHAEVGARIVEHVEGLERVALAVKHHHERFDGLGYPDGLVGEGIPLTARLVAVVDVYDCLTSNRSYRHAIPNETALAEVIRAKGTQLDSKIVEAFMSVINKEAPGAGPVQTAAMETAGSRP